MKRLWKSQKAKVWNLNLKKINETTIVKLIKKFSFQITKNQKRQEFFFNRPCIIHKLLFCNCDHA